MLRTTSQGARAPMDACIRRRAGHTTTSQGTQALWTLVLGSFVSAVLSI